MVFKRRTPLTFWAWLREQVYPSRGFKRAVLYMWHRLRRLPDPPHRIARGVFAGTLVNFPPIFGFQMIAAVALAWAMRGNILAALLATFLSNPITTPLIALVSLRLGHWMLGTVEPFSMTMVFGAFSHAGQDLWHNFLAIFSPQEAHWEGLKQFWHQLYLPYLVGSILPGLVVAGALSWITVPAMNTYQNLQRKRRALHRLKQRNKATEAANVDDEPTTNP
ncbi:MAG: DUF2062 domain-containing protein [Paracoccaceae bacterium]